MSDSVYESRRPVRIIPTTAEKTTVVSGIAEKTEKPEILLRKKPRKALPATSGMHKKNKHKNLQKIMEKLKEAARNKDGCFDKSDLNKALKDLDAILPGWRAHRAFGKVDANNDGEISGEEIDSLLQYLSSCGF